MPPLPRSTDPMSLSVARVQVAARLIPPFRMRRVSPYLAPQGIRTFSGFPPWTAERRKRYSQGARWHRGDSVTTLRTGVPDLTIDGEQSAQESALQAVRQLGFEVRPIEHEKTETPSGLSEISKALIALALAIGAEALDFFAPDTLPFKGLGMALAAAAIAFSGFSTYRKGLAALRRGQLNMNALMGVAVTGAF